MFAQAAPEPTLASQLVGGYLAFLLAASMTGWFWLARRRQETGYLLAQRDSALTPWSISDLALMIFLYLVSQAAGLKLASVIGGFALSEAAFESLEPQQRVTLIVSATSMQWVAMLVLVTWLKLGVGATWRDLGLSWSLLASDFKIGVFAFILITPPVMMLQAGLSSMFPDQQHPFIEAMNGEAGRAMMGAIFFAAVATAPLYEELMFRVIGLGWLEQFSAEMEEANRQVDELDSPSADELRIEAAMKELEDEPAEEPQPLGRRAGWRPVPIVISAFLFAAVHLGHGPAPISLFFFALGLGYVFQRTRRLLPCVIIHTLLNLQTTAMLFLLSGSGESVGS